MIDLHLFSEINHKKTRSSEQQLTHAKINSFTQPTNQPTSIGKIHSREFFLINIITRFQVNIMEEKETEIVKQKRRKLTQEDNMASLTEHLMDLRAVVIKSAIVIVIWFVIVFATVTWWFPYVSKGADIV